MGLSDTLAQRIIRLHRRGWSYPKIAARLGVHRETVGRYIRKLKEPTHVVGVALYNKDVTKLRRRAKKKKKSVSDLVREIVNKHLN